MQETLKENASLVRKKKAIFFVGMMASGKSTVGRELARKIGWDFFDIDSVIVKEKGMSITEIFEREGEAAFRFYETQTMAQYTQRERVVLAMGGGAPMFEVNRTLLARGFVVQLAVGVSDVLERTKNDTTRPLLQCEDPTARVRSMLIDRAPVYDAVSDMKIHVSRKTPQQIAALVLEDKRVQEMLSALEKEGE